MNDMRQMTELGRKIESGSFAIIDEEAGSHTYGEEEWQVVRRVIHSTADFDFKNLTKFNHSPIASGIKALANGCNIITDVRMISIGLNERRLSQLGCNVHCFISDEDVIADARANNSTRAVYAMKKAASLGLMDNSIIAVGNAPTALIETARQVNEGESNPALVVGVPVGFVSAAESKEEIYNTKVPSIITKGRKGGSPIAVAILHALMYLLAGVK